MKEKPYTEQDYSEDALMLYIGLLKDRKTKKAKRLFREALGEIKDKGIKSDLVLAVSGANAIIVLPEFLRPYIGQEAQERTLKKLRERIDSKTLQQSL